MGAIAGTGGTTAAGVTTGGVGAAVGVGDSGAGAGAGANKSFVRTSRRLSIQPRSAGGDSVAGAGTGADVRASADGAGAADAGLASGVGGFFLKKLNMKFRG
jgi:hypothetical protein